MLTDGRTDMAKLIVGFRNLANAPEKGRIFWAGTCNRVVQTCCMILSKTPTNKPLPTVSSRSNCVPTGHHEIS